MNGFSILSAEPANEQIATAFHDNLKDSWLNKDDGMALLQTFRSFSP